MYNFSLQYPHLALPTSELCVMSALSISFQTALEVGFTHNADGPATGLTKSSTILKVLILIYLLLYYFIMSNLMLSLNITARFWK